MVRSIQRQMIIWTFVLVVAVGALVAIMMLQPPTTEAKLAHSSNFLRERKKLLGERKGAPAPKIVERASAPGEAAKRVPASTKSRLEVEQTQSQIAAGERIFQAIDMKVGCDRAGNGKLAADVVQIRLVGPLCAKESEILSSEVKNTRNGFSATVFKTKDHGFTTDYISIAQGENKIRIIHRLQGGGVEEREITVVRAE